MARKPHIVRTATPAGRGSATSHASQVNGNWLSAQAQEAIAKMRVHRSFDEARDPMMARQLADADKTEAQRREDQTSGGQAQRPRQTPANLNDVETSIDAGAMLRAQYEAAMANRPNSGSAVRHQSLQPTRDPPEPRLQRPYWGPSQ